MNLRPIFRTLDRLALAGLALVASSASAQVADQGTLIVRAGGRDIGVETFQVTPNANGLRVTATASYLSPRPGVELTASLDRTGDTEGAFQLGRKAGASSAEVYAVLKRNRLTIRRVERGAEQASESPGGAGLIILADSIFALYLQIVPLATDEGRLLTAVLPQAVRRISFTAQRQPSKEPGGSLVRLSGGLEGVIELGRAGELIRVSLPAIGLDATRRRD
jgi:hypothetical protein